MSDQRYELTITTPSGHFRLDPKVNRGPGRALSFDEAHELVQVIARLESIEVDVALGALTRALVMPLAGVGALTVKVVL